MSKADKQKNSFETPPKQYSSPQPHTSRNSVFGRLGNRHQNAPQVSDIPEEKVEQVRMKSTASMKHHSSKSSAGHHHRLDDADPDLLEQKRAELKKELELQLKMESAARKPKSSGLTTKSAAELARKRKQMTRRSSSSSSSSSSGSDSSSDSSSSDSAAARRTGKARKNVKTKRHQSSSSSGDEDPRRKLKSAASSSGASKAKRVCHKKLDASGKVKSNHLKKSTLDKPNLIVHRKRTPSPSQIVIRKHQRPTSPGSAHKSAGGKQPSKAYPDQAAAMKHHRMKEHSQTMPGAGPSGQGLHRSSDKEREFQMREREREREHQQHMRSRERMRSRSPPPLQQGKQMRMKSRSPPGAFKRLSRPRDVKQRSPQPNVPQRRATSKSRSGGAVGLSSGVRRTDRTPERIIIKKDVSGKRHESSREREHRRERDRERESVAIREKDRLEMIRLQEQRRERERLDQDRLRVKVIDPRDREVDQRVGKTERLLPRPAERAMALAAARDQARDKSEDRSVSDMHHRPRSHSHSRSNRDRVAIDRNDVYAERGYDRLDDRYDMHRRPDMDRSSAGLLRDDRSDRVDRDRDYVSMRRREDSRGRIIEEIIDPYLPREKVRGGPVSERDRSIEREREQRSGYGNERDRDQRVHGDRYDEAGGRGGGGSVDERRGRGGSERGHDYGRPSSRGAYIDEPARGAPHRAPLEPQHRGERSGPDREAWYRGPEEPSSSRGDDRGHHHPYDRHSGRDWDHNDRSAGNRQPSAGRAEGNYPIDEGRRDGNTNPDWSSRNERPWSDGRGLDRGHGAERGGGGGSQGGDRGDRPNWHHAERDVENWDVSDEYGPGDFHRGGHGDKMHHDAEPLTHAGGSGNRGGPGNRRWPNWRGGRGGGRGGGGIGNDHHGPQSNNLFRRQNHMHNQQDGFQDHQGDHPFRRQPIGGQSGEYQQPHHHGHNAFSNSIVRPLLSLPPLKPPIMDDIVPISLLPSMAQKKLLPTTVLNPIVTGMIANEETLSVGPPKPMVVAEPTTILNKATEDKPLPDKVEGVKETSAPLNAELNPDGTAPDKEAGDADGEEDALSEISDDADDILNRQEQEAAALLAAASLAAVVPSTPLQKPALLPTPPFKVGEFPRLIVNQPFAQINLLPMPFDDHHHHHMHHHHHHPNAILIKPPIVSAITNPDLHTDTNADDLDLDFEEISDGELEEEARIRGMGDALGVDWASLVEESKAKANEQRSNVFASAKQRWQPHRILLDVGVSFRMAGKDFASNVLNAAHRKLTAEETAARQLQEEAANKQKEEHVEFTIKKEVQDDDEFGENGTTTTTTEQVVFSVKTIEESYESSEPPQAELLIHPIACVQVASRVNAEIRKNVVFGMTGPYSRALSAQKDVQMRRQLCGLSMKPCGGPLKSRRPVGSGGVDYAAMARQLFEKALGQVN